MPDIQKLRELVNPVYNTALSCVQLQAASGDNEAQRLLDIMGVPSFGQSASDKPIPPELVEQVKRLEPAYTLVIETRYRTMNTLIDQRPECEVVDLPCGYTSRGVRMHREGRTYFGLDLPAVIDSIGVAAAQVITELGGSCDDGRVSYHYVDATNYNSLEKALENATGNLLITTEGLLMYFTQPELEEVFANIHRLLSKYGGSWVIADHGADKGNMEAVKAALGNDSQLIGMFEAITTRAASTTADITIYNNVFFDPDDDKLKAFIRDMGFELRLICEYDLLPEKLGSLRHVPELEDAVRQTYRNRYLWELTVPKGAKTYEHHSKTFSADGVVSGSVFQVRLSGRLDTLTSTDLLELYHNVDKDSLKGIELDFSDLDYLSSAGIRVLMIMYKDLGENGSFVIKNANDTVRGAISLTGLDAVFGM